MKKRIAQLNSLVQAEVGSQLMLYPNENFGLLTISKVEVSPDGGYAKIWITTTNKDSDVEALNEYLKEIRSPIQLALGGRIHARKTPIIRFMIDNSTSYYENIENILKELKK